MKEANRENIVWMVATIGIMAAVMAAVVFSPLERAISSEDETIYVGCRKCKTCHKLEVMLWSKTRHAHAMERLKSQGHERNNACVPCHVTGFGKPHGFIDPQITPEFEGVQCEACHGPGKAHTLNSEKVHMPVPIPSTKECRICHTKEQDSNFDYETMSQLVHHKFDEELAPCTQEQAPVEVGSAPCE